MVKSVFDIDQLHFQLMLGNAIKRDIKRFLLRLFVAPLDFKVFLGRNADDRLERQNQPLIRYIHNPAHALAQLHAARRFGHDAHAVVQVKPIRVKVI